MQKQSFYFSLLILIVLVGFNSCTIEKRSYQPGYYVDWHNANRKSKTNTEIELKKGQETVCKDKIVVENNVEKIEDFIQPIAIQEIEPVYASNDENTNNIEIICNTKQKNKFSSNTGKFTPEIYESEKEEKTINSFDNLKEEGGTKVHWAAKVGLLLSIIGVVAFFVVTFYASSMLMVTILFILSFLSAITGVIFSHIAIEKISNYPNIYRGNEFAYAGIIIGIIYLLILMQMGFLVLLIL